MQAKTKELKTTLNSEFGLIHELCVFVLLNTRKPDLIRATLDTLAVYLTWVPLGYIFESNLLQMLLQLFPQPTYRNVALQCLTEVRRLRLSHLLFCGWGRAGQPPAACGWAGRLRCWQHCGKRRAQRLGGCGGGWFVLRGGLHLHPVVRTPPADQLAGHGQRLQPPLRAHLQGLHDAAAAGGAAHRQHPRRVSAGFPRGAGGASCYPLLPGHSRMWLGRLRRHDSCTATGRTSLFSAQAACARVPRVLG